MIEQNNKLDDLIAENNRLNKRLAALESIINGGHIVAKSIKVENGSPYNISIHAGSNIAGVWVNGKPEDGIVALYTMDTQGSVVGVWGYPQKDALDIALSTKNGPVIQIYDRKTERIYRVDTQQVSKFIPSAPIKKDD